MLYDLCLMLSLAFGLWLALDWWSAEAWRRRSPAIAFLGLSGAAWAASEVLLGRAAAPEEFAFGRRLLYLGSLSLPVCWVWVAIEAARPRWWRNRWLAPVALPSLAFFSLLFWAPNGTLVDLTSPTPRHGPMFLWATGWSWLLGLTGLVFYAWAWRRLRDAGSGRAGALAVGVATPLAINAMYAAGVFGSLDPAPALLGFSVCMIRLALVDEGLASYLPLGRSDVVEQLDVGIVLADRSGHVLEANSAARRLLGALEVRTLEAWLAPLAGRPEIEIQRFPLRRGLRRVGEAVVLSDRSNARQAEGRLQLASRLETIGTLTAGIAHEVNNPLAFIRANLAELEKLCAPLRDESASQRLPVSLEPLALDGPAIVEETRDGIDRIATLVQRLKAMAHPDLDSLAEREIDLVEVANRSAAMAAVSVPLGAIRISAPSSLMLVTSEGAVHQILLNLLLNAIQASDSEPEIDLEVGSSGDEAWVRVSDRGQGIAADALEHLFDPFYTTKSGGTGLGLSLGFDLAQRLGGRLEAASRPGGGACFSLVLPGAA